MKQGLCLTTPGGTTYFHGCKDVATGLKEMAAQSYVYGAAWADPLTTIDFGTFDPATFAFTAAERVKGPAPAKEA